jgi:hypothetical protein
LDVDSVVGVTVLLFEMDHIFDCRVTLRSFIDVAPDTTFVGCVQKVNGIETNIFPVLGIGAAAAVIVV